MIRFRFHGRGGQGMKTASRILGTAAFLSGYQAQDTPLYGAERRGAPMVSCTRIDTKPILFHGPIERPDIVLLADKSLLENPANHIISGLVAGGVLVVNTSDGGPLEEIDLPVQLIRFDATSLALQVLGLPVISAIMGAAACKISGIVDPDRMEQAVGEELAALGLEGSQLAKNLEAAWRTYQMVPGGRIEPRPAETVRPLPPAPLRYAGGIAGTPTVARPLNMRERHTGNWRIYRPWIETALCTRCALCFLACPEGCLRPDEEGYPYIDYDNCKGCLICEEVCPREGAVYSEREGSAA